MVRICLRSLNSLTKQTNSYNMKTFFLLRNAALALAAGFTIATADANITFLGVAAGDASTNDVIVWTRAKDESNPQPTDINAQFTTDSTFTSGIATMLAG